MSTQQFGGWLRHEREARGLTVAAIASQTKIPPRHLEAIERGDTLALPAFYQRAEVRAVARAVGVDERLAMARLDAELAPVEPPPAARSKPTIRVRSEYVAAALGVAAVLLVGLAGWGSFERTAASEGAVETRQDAAAPAAPTQSEAVNAPVVESVAASADDAPVASTGPTELVIRTQPEGARVTVDGIGWGQSPVNIRHLEPGEKHIRVTMDGYTSAERSVTVEEGGRETVRISLVASGS